MVYATLDEVWGSDFKKCNRKKKRKNISEKQQNSHNQNSLIQQSQTTDPELDQYYNDNFEGFSDYSEILTDTDQNNQTQQNNPIQNDNQDSVFSEMNNLDGLGDYDNEYYSFDKDNNLNMNISEDESSFSENNTSDNENNENKINIDLVEINNKIDHILERLNKLDLENNEKNMNDIILFIVFGIFFIILIDMIFRFAHKINPQS